MRSDETYMALALEEARRAAALGEVPIGSVVVCEGALVASGHNRREIDHDPAGHAEFLAIRAASSALERWRLSDCTVYDLSSDERLNHRFEVTSGVGAEESSELLRSFFRELREGRS